MLRLAIICFAVAGCATSQPPRQGGDWLFVWTSDAGAESSDFLAVIDARPGSPTYANVLATAPAGASGTNAHHVEHQMPEGGILFANGWRAGRTFRFDLNDPLRPRLLDSFTDAGQFMHAHSFARLANGNVLATYQMRGHGNVRPGALVELSQAGEVLRIAPADDPQGEASTRPYSIAVVPSLDRVVTSSADMHGDVSVRSVQVWRLSDLSLIATVPLPPGPRGNENEASAEPRLLSDGRTVLVSTFRCGLFRILALEGERPSAELVYSSDSSRQCALPVVTGNYWVQTDFDVPGLIALDVSDPGRPREVGRLVLPPDYLPHWISLAPDGERIAITGFGAMHSLLLMARIDRATGRLTLDERFRPAGADRPGVSFDRTDWPHGPTGRAIPHGVVFSLPGRR
jgi:hypothetical protein